MIKMDEIRKMKVEDLVKVSSELRDDIAELRRRIYMGEVQNPRIVRIKRRELARMLTVLGEHLAKEKA